MALINAFGEIALDASVQEVKDSVDALTTTVENGIDLTSSTISNIKNGLATETAVNAITTTLDNGISVSGSVVALDGGTLAALETINANTGGLTDAQLRASAVPVSITGSIPVTIASAIEITNDAGNAIPVSATSLPLPSDAATETTLQAINLKLAGTLDVNVGLTDAELRASPLSVSDATIDGHFKTYASAHSGTDKGLVALGDKDGVLDTFKMDASGNLITALPTGAATETTLTAIETLLTNQQSILEALNTLNDTLVYMLSSVLEKLPRVTGNDQAAVSIEAGAVSLNSNQTLATVTTVGTITTQTQIGGQDALSVARSQMIPFHLYNNISVV